MSGPASAPDPNLDEVTTHGLLREILVELRAIRRAVEDPGRPSTLTKADRIRLERLLPACAILFPHGELFTARDLMAHPAPGFRVLRGRLSTKALGRLLTRAHTRVVAGFRVEHIGTERNVNLFRVAAC
jgi:hypothetical protein